MCTTDWPRRLALADFYEKQRWLRFAKSGVPVGPDDEPTWDAYDPIGRATLVIDKQDRTVPDLDGPLRAAWGEQVIAFT